MVAENLPPDGNKDGKRPNSGGKPRSEKLAAVCEEDFGFQIASFRGHRLYLIAILVAAICMAAFPPVFLYWQLRETYASLFPLYAKIATPVVFLAGSMWFAFEAYNRWRYHVRVFELGLIASDRRNVARMLLWRGIQQITEVNSVEVHATGGRNIRRIAFVIAGRDGPSVSIKREEIGDFDGAFELVKQKATEFEIPWELTSKVTNLPI